MGKIKKHPPVKLVMGFIFAEELYLRRALVILERRFGAVDFKSQTLGFIHTDYYQKEFGRNLKRTFVSFKRLIRPQSLAGIKAVTNSIEGLLSCDSLRLINIDPGYLDLAKLILATTKDFKHRIYLGAGIFAEVALYYQDKTFRPWDFTYPDYKTCGYIDIFNQIRRIYASQLKTA